MTDIEPTPVWVVCTTPDCPEVGTPKTADGFPDEAAAGDIICGGCGNPTALSTAEGGVVE